MAYILAFDDSKLIQGVICSVLAPLSHEVEAVCPISIFDALRHLYRIRPALLLTDYDMPNVNGETLLRVIREDQHLRGLKVIMLSSHHESDLITRVIQHGADGYVIKSGSMKEDLPRQVQKVLGG